MAGAILNWRESKKWMKKPNGSAAFINRVTLNSVSIWIFHGTTLLLNQATKQIDPIHIIVGKLRKKHRWMWEEKKTIFLPIFPSIHHFQFEFFPIKNTQSWLFFINSFCKFSFNGLKNDHFDTSFNVRVLANLHESIDVIDKMTWKQTRAAIISLLAWCLTLAQFCALFHAYYFAI